MERDVSIDSMVYLPRLNGLSAVTLGEQLLSAAEVAMGEGLPVFIERPRGRLQVAVLGLKGALTPQEVADSGVALAADYSMDGAWRSFSKWLDSLKGMPEGSFPELDKVRALNTRLFSEGLSFIILSFREEWTESETRLKAIAEGGYAPMIDKLGGGLFLTNLKEAHARYGEAIGIGAPVTVKESPEVRANMDKLAAAMKSYIVKAVAYADPEEPGSQALSEALLVPFVQWKDTPSRPNPPADAPVSE